MAANRLDRLSVLGGDPRRRARPDPHDSGDLQRGQRRKSQSAPDPGHRTSPGSGNFYGTTPAGGANGFGSIFSITPGGTLTTLYSFTGAADGATPLAPLLQGMDENFYGTASAGGTGSGTIFSLTRAGAFKVLYTFTGALDGGVPLGGLAQDNGGNFYGTTSVGGAHSNAGTIFALASSPQGDGTGTFTTRYNFCGMDECHDGATPEAGLVQGTDGKFYGATANGGFYSDQNCSTYSFGGCGTIFISTGIQSSPAGVLTTLYAFCAGSDNCADGVTPTAPLFQAADGNFYGTASGSPAPHDVVDTGTIFSITPAGVFTALYSFGICDTCTTGKPSPWRGGSRPRRELLWDYLQPAVVK